jgi:hypothetical protein
MHSADQHGSTVLDPCALFASHHARYGCHPPDLHLSALAGVVSVNELHMLAVVYYLFLPIPSLSVSSECIKNRGLCSLIILSEEISDSI